eukprot:1044244-Karenia_brevis.AAC.1
MTHAPGVAPSGAWHVDGFIKAACTSVACSRGRVFCLHCSLVRQAAGILGTLRSVVATTVA